MSQLCDLYLFIQYLIRNKVDENVTWVNVLVTYSNGTDAKEKVFRQLAKASNLPIFITRTCIIYTLYVYILYIIRKSSVGGKSYFDFRKQCIAFCELSRSVTLGAGAPLPLQQIFILFDWLQSPLHMNARLIRCVGVLWRLIKRQIKSQQSVAFAIEFIKLSNQIFTRWHRKFAHIELKHK